MSYYVPPGAPPPPPPARNPTPTSCQAARCSRLRQSLRTPRDPADPHRALLAAWAAHHGSDWVRADALHPAVRSMIDPKERIAAARQRLPQLVASCPELEARTTGNAAKRTTLYRLVETA